MNRLRAFFELLAAVLACAMSAVVAYNYRGMLCGVEHAGYSAPAGIALLSAIPFVPAIVVCVLMAIKFSRR